MTTPEVVNPTTENETIATGTALYCYECSEQYDSTFDPSQSPCLNNLSQVTIRQCSPADTYCQVRSDSTSPEYIICYFLLLCMNF